MKIQYALLGSLILLTGCVNNAPTKVITKGPLICSTGDVCPSLSAKWNQETRDGFKITADIDNPTKYDIKQLVFVVDGQAYTYSTIQPTVYTEAAGIVNSSNSIFVPRSFLNSFRNAKEIDLKLVTDQGEIVRPILTADGQKSSAFLTFEKGYTEELPGK
ncbi:hypothetical protein [Acinetobacter stercoris]|uniref:Lipoprotein n=1 Tax=Acinetobacter stercoris TaxID=2126983 RepID=A0A2U3N1B2_9GAMM|nr:hypothetical protein [Acinetobacter stercoris]SPL71467.1 hypothetical protein KPC_2645 [Acinetobacter stercoris]